MSPTYSIPSVDTLHRGEKLFTTVTRLQRDQASDYGLRERIRPSSARSYSSSSSSRRPRSGSPQVHPDLKATPDTVTEDSRRASNIRSRPGLRSHASLDLSELKASHGGVLGVSSEVESVRWLQDQKRMRLTPSPGRLTPRSTPSFYGPDALSGSSSMSNSTITPSSGRLTPRSSPSFYRPDILSGISSMSNSTIKRSCREDQDRESLETGDPSLDVNGETARGLDGALPHVQKEREVGAIETFSPRPSRTANDTAWPVLGAEDGSRSSSSVFSNSSSAQSGASSSQHTAGTEHSTGDDLTEKQHRPVEQLPATSAHYNPSVRSSSMTASHRRHRSNTTGSAPAEDYPDRCGTPETPRGRAKLRHHLMINDRVPAQHSRPKHLPVEEKLPMSGYELPGSRPHSSASSSFPDVGQRPTTTTTPPQENAELTIKPIYRRFESLNHRLLLHLQDELSELEEQLHRLDATDTQTRRLQSNSMPASRRAEVLAGGGELQWQKGDILSRIGFKLGQYNHTLSSLISIRDLPAPTHESVREYREYLATHRPISDVETRFLDSTDDLVTLKAPADTSFSSSATTAASAAAQRKHQRDNGDEEYIRSLRRENQQPPQHALTTVTPIPGTMHGNSWLLRHQRLSFGSRSSSRAGSSVSGGGSPRFPPGGATTAAPTSHPVSSSRPFESSHYQAQLLSAPPLPLRKPQRAASVRSSSPSAASASGSVASEGGKEARRGEKSKSSSPERREGEQHQQHQQQHLTVAHLATAIAVAVLVPVLAFSIVAGFVARMSVVLLVGLAVAGFAAQSGRVKKAHASGSTGDLLCGVGVYGGVMAVVAGLMA